MVLAVINRDPVGISGSESVNLLSAKLMLSI